MVSAEEGSNPIAIVGIGLRLPGGCHDSKSFWDFLVDGRDARKPIPPERFNIDGFYNGADSASSGIGSLSMKQGYFLEEPVDRFDAAFFSMSQTEVERVDPQQRLLLEVVYEALENAGETNWRGKNIAVYTGSFGQDWLQMQAKDPQDGGVYEITGMDDFVLANRISYEFDFRGPSMTIKVGCSSSLVALHLACEALQRGDCSSAVVGASNLLLSPEYFMALDNLHALSPDGSSKSFDASANGFARADAVNAIYVKRLEDALRDGNPIRAIIRGTSVNADGKTVGLTNPSSEVQAALIKRAYKKAGITNLADTPFVECHGTGTAAGDPLETSAVANVFGDQGIYIGSVKPNVGHSEGAAGLTSLIKGVLSLEQQTIPPNIKFDTPNPKIPFNKANLTVPVQAVPWPYGRRQRVSINSFGLGGANAHVILDAATYSSRLKGVITNGPEVNGNDANGHHTYRHQTNGNHTNGHHTNGHHTNGHLSNGLLSNGLLSNGHLSNGHLSNGHLPNGNKPSSNLRANHSQQHLLVFSSHSETSMEKMISNYQKFISSERFEISDLEYTLNVRRHHRNVRTFCVTDGKSIQANPIVQTLKFHGLLFIFTGQGAQWPGMGRQLINDFPSFKEDVQKMDSWLAQCSHAPSWRIEEILQESRDIHTAEYAQPLCTAIQLGLVNLLGRWGVHPAAVVGHSSGEIAAAYAAGAIGMKEALLVAFYRGVASEHQRRPGAMAAVGLSREEVSDLLVGNVTIACENSRSSVTISGDTSGVEAVLDRVRQYQPEALARRLKVDRAYHSVHMKSVGEYYERLIASITTAREQLKIPFFSSVTGHVIYNPTLLGPSYWRSNMEQPVLFLSAVESALQETDALSIALELGPHAALSGPFHQICKGMKLSIPYTNCLSRGEDCTSTILRSLGQLYCNGLVPDFAALNSGGRTLSNLPPYPWVHNTSYWHESRISYQYRMRKHAEHELLGAPTVGGNDLEPSWRKVLHLKNSPWLYDHAVGGDVVFPAAGYIAIVGEAIKQLSGHPSFTIRSVTIGAAMLLQSGRPTEIITRLQPRRLTTDLDSSWYEFAILSYDGKQWTKNCSGEVHTGQSVTGLLLIEEPSNIGASRPVDSSHWYKAAKTAGLEYGPAFQGLQSIQYDVSQCAISANILSARDPKISSYPLHPTTLDQLLQCCILCSVQGHLRFMNKLVLPTYIEEMYIEPKEGSSLQIYTEVKSNTGNVLSSNGQITARDGSLMLQSRGLRFRFLDTVTPSTVNDPLQELRLLEWKPDVDLVGPKQLIHQTIDLTSCVELVEKLSILCAIETTRLLYGAESSLHHMRRFKEWNEDYISNIKQHGSKVVKDTQHLFQLTSEERQAMIRELTTKSLETPAKNISSGVVRIYDAVEGIFQGTVEPLAVLLPDNILMEIYNYFNMLDYSQFFQLLGHSNPTMRILEIGAGTGGFTSTILPALTKPGRKCMFSTYTYTDISSGFFKASRERFRDYPNLEHVVLDISKDPAEQGLQLNSYDLVLASNVLHATPDLHQTLVNCRSLLRTGGRLFLLELCTEAKWINYIMGTLSGWWLGESDGRPNEPYLQAEQWDTVLQKAGFAGIETSVMDHAEPYQLNNIIISRAVEADIEPRKTLSLLVSDTAIVNSSAKALKTQFESTGYDVSLCSLWDLPPSSVDVISLLDIDGSESFFQNLSEKDLRGLTRFISRSRKNKILWITCPAQVSVQNPYFAMILGFARTLRLELGTTFATLELDPSDGSPSLWNSVVQVFKKIQVNLQVGYSSSDSEFAIVNGSVCVPRFTTSNIKTLLTSTLATADKGFKTLRISNPGLLSSLQWVLQPKEELQDGEVEIEVAVASVTSWDVLLATGVLYNDRDLGLECAGVINRVGPNGSHDLKLGDRVVCWFPGSLASYVRVDAQWCCKIPDSSSFKEVVSLPMAHGMAIRALLEIGNLTQGETILVHSGAEAVGIAAIQIAQMIGSKIFATAATNEQRQFLEMEHGIPPSQIFSSQDKSFITGIMRATNSRGVDIVINSLSGNLRQDSWKCVSEGGSFIDLGGRDSSGHASLHLGLLDGNRSFHNIDIAALFLHRPEVARRLLQKTIDLYREGSIKPISPITKFGPSSIQEAFRHLHGNQVAGATCIEFLSDFEVHPDNLHVEEARFRKDRAYLLVGGLGGLGKAAAVWLAERGAGCIIFLTRSASTTAANDELILELNALGCMAQVITGSITEITTMEKLVVNAAKPIAGVLHLALVLRDEKLLEMTFDNWTDATVAKVQGTWNLHNALKDQPLDFFVLLSSIYGIHGNPGQANYAAASTFLDAFVQFRQNLGLPASVIDLGVMEDIGYVSRHPTILENLRRAGAQLIGENDFLESLKLAIRSSSLNKPSLPTMTESYVNRAQFVVGTAQHAPDARGRGLTANGSQDVSDIVLYPNNETDSAATLRRFVDNVKADPSTLEDTEAVDEFLATQVVECVKSLLVFGDNSEVSTSQKLADLGLDSLIAVELQSWWMLNLGTRVSILELTNSASILELGRLARVRIEESLNA